LKPNDFFDRSRGRQATANDPTQQGLKPDSRFAELAELRATANDPTQQGLKRLAVFLGLLGKEGHSE
tara:strand:+ start:274 stop:474 length:201 start_codon:yes stop_codon:yes gene_type:complete